MKRIMCSLAMIGVLIACAGLAAAQCAGGSFGGFDLLQTVNGTQDTNPGGGLSSVSFSGMPLPGGVAGTADTIVCRTVALKNPIPSGGQAVPIQIVALLLQGTAMYQGVMRTVYAAINQTQNSAGVYQIPTSELPAPPSSVPLKPSTGSMTVFPDGTFNTTSLTVQALIIIVPMGDPVTATPVATFAMNADSISATGSNWTATAPPGYPSSSVFPAGGFYVTQSGSGGAAIPLMTSRIVTGSLFALGLVLVGIAILKIRSGIRGGRLTMRPVYLLGMAAIAWFLGWKSTKLTFPTIVQAAATCVPRTMSVMVDEGGFIVVHKIVTAVCSNTTTTITASIGLH